MFDLKNATVLTRAQQKNVKGGGTQTCRFTVVGNTGTQRFVRSGFSEGAAGSAEARAACSWLAAGDMDTRCFYDCEYDGYGQ